MERVGRDVGVLLRADGMPVANPNLAVFAAAGNFGASALLLAAEDPIWKPVVGDDVIELRRRLIVPGAPRLSVIHRERRTLVDAEQNHVAIGGADPDRMVVVAARRAFNRDERFPAVGR